MPCGYSVLGSDATIRMLVRAPEAACWREHERGLHFPTMEAPAERVSDLREFFSDLR